MLGRASSSLIVLVALLLGQGQARAQEPPRDRDWQVGLNVRSGLTTHPVRVDGGVRFHLWSFGLVLDPSYFLDGEHDLDSWAARELRPGWAVFAGLRNTAVAIAGGVQWQEKTLCGLLLSPPPLAGGHVRLQLGLELAILWLKHGGGLPTKAIELNRELADFVVVGMFARFGYASSSF